MTTKRTHGPCSVECQRRRTSLGAHVGHQPDCPSLYPAQHEPDALTEVARLVRMMKKEQLQRRSDELAERVLDLISEAREEQRKAVARAKNEGLEEAASHCEDFGCPCAKDIRHMKDPEP